jgi:glycosyltransferase involved in cell wall biosynthesis
LLVTIHDLAHLVLYQSSLDFIKKRYARYFFKKILQKADKIITVSNFSKNEYTKYFGLEKDFKQIVAIHNGISINKNIYSNPYNRPYILTVGNIKPHKNLSRLLDAFNKIMDSIPHTLLIVGKKSGFIGGDMNLIKKANAFGERVVMTGFLSDDKLQSYYSHADAFIFPSIYEGFGFPPLEAMAAGIPVIASKAASITEVCGDAALYFDPYNIDEMAENILQMVNDQTLGNLYISKGKNHVKKYTWDKTAFQTSNIIKNLLERD